MRGHDFLKALSFTVLGLTLLSLAIAAPTALAAGISVDLSGPWIGQTITVNADGFHPNEGVSTWVGRPDGSATGTGTYKADAAGELTYTIKPGSDWPLGDYQVVARGKSGIQFVTSFRLYGVEPEPEQAPVLVRMPDPQGLTLQYSGKGYQANELLDVWYARPDGATIASAMQRADAWGNAFFNFTVGQNWQYGGYRLVARGVTSKVSTYMEFSFFGTITSLVASNPMDQPPAPVTFSASGFIPGENVSIWTGQPNGTTRFLAVKNADSSGSISYVLNVVPGMWQGTYRMVAYGWFSHKLVFQDMGVFF